MICATIFSETLLGCCAVGYQAVQSHVEQYDWLTYDTYGRITTLRREKLLIYTSVITGDHSYVTAVTVVRIPPLVSV